MLGFFGTPGWSEMLIVGGIALLLFGKRLPEVARSLGKGMREFKEGLAGMQDEFNAASAPSSSRRENLQSSRPAPRDEADDRGDFAAPKFEPPQEPQTVASNETHSPTV